MKKLFTFILATAFILSGSLAADAATKVNGYTRKDGTRVNSYYRSDSDSRKSNNYSSKGNVNPYTGKKGSKKY